MKKVFAFILAIMLVFASSCVALADDVQANAGGNILRLGKPSVRYGYWEMKLPIQPKSWDLTVQFDFKYSSECNQTNFGIWRAYNGEWCGPLLLLNNGKLRVNYVTEKEDTIESAQEFKADVWHTIVLKFNKDASFSVLVDGTVIKFGDYETLHSTYKTLITTIYPLGDNTTINANFEDAEQMGALKYGDGLSDGIGYWDNFKITEGDTVIYTNDFESDEAKKSATPDGAYARFVKDDDTHKTVIVNNQKEALSGFARINISNPAKSDNWTLGFDFRVPSKDDYVPEAGLGKACGNGVPIFQTYPGSGSYVGPRLSLTEGKIKEVNLNADFEGITLETGVWYHFDLKFEGKKCTLFVNGTALKINGSEQFEVETAPLKNVIGYIGDVSSANHEGVVDYDNFTVTENGVVIWENNFSTEVLRSVCDEGMLSMSEGNTGFINIGGEEKIVETKKEEEKPEQPPKDDKPADNPTTGDDMVLFAFLTTLALAGGLALSKKK